jgi:serine/threonine protein phosphatase PrpC
VNQDAFGVKSYNLLGAVLDLYVVCDGHGKGGEKVSGFCVREIPEMIRRFIEKRRLVSDQIIEDSIKDSCGLAQKLLEKSDIQIKMAGTTFVITVIWNEKIFMGTCGDSRAFLASKKGNHVVCRLTTEDHKPEDR